tara:strand:- start:24009 stop:24329 length:321 start_codon:yes stop_codon:yes gene_type:complete
MIHYNNNGALASFETEEAMLKTFPNGLAEVVDLQAFLNPPLTFDQELDSLNSKYDSDFIDLVNEYNRAVARDGVTESVKVDTVRSKMTTLDSEYDSAFMALLIKYS